MEPSEALKEAIAAVAVPEWAAGASHHERAVSPENLVYIAKAMRHGGLKREAKQWAYAIALLLGLAYAGAYALTLLVSFARGNP
jgi:hypothetical protein